MNQIDKLYEHNASRPVTSFEVEQGIAIRYRARQIVRLGSKVRLWASTSSDTDPTCSTSLGNGHDEIQIC
jgi:hypothetical protein